MRNRIVVIGGGLAGLTAALHLSKSDWEVTLIEKQAYPHHKVCGEFISSEILPYWESIGINLNDLDIQKIHQVEFSLNDFKIRETLPHYGIGISRYAIDDYLYQLCLKSGIDIIQETVVDVHFSDSFEILLQNNRTLHSDFVIGAQGKRSNLDKKLNRKFMQEKAHWMAVKRHFPANIDADLVGLHFFDGGYCGISQVENNRMNCCYLLDVNTFKKYRDIDDFEQKVLLKQPQIAAILKDADSIFDKPLTISQINFSDKPCVENHLLCIGDAAGMIHPLTGNGMAMAIHSAKLTAEALIKFPNPKDRSRMEAYYKKTWKSAFAKRLILSRSVSKLMRNKTTSKMLFQTLKRMPFLLSILIRNTQGKSVS